MHLFFKRPVALLLFVALAFVIASRGMVPAMSKIDSDFPNYFTAAKIVADGGDVERLYDNSWFQGQMRRYQIGKPSEGKFAPFPPPTALLLVPLTRLEPLNALRVMTGVSTLCLVCSTILLARTDANAAALLTSDVDERDKPFITGERTAEGFYRVRAGIDQAIARAVSYAPYVDLLWCETSEPKLSEAKRFAEGVHQAHPNKLLAYNCSPSFNWKKKLDDTTIARFQRELGAMGYKFQFITLAGFHALNYSMFNLARGYQERGMSAYAELQEAEFSAEAHGYTATRHQREVGTGYFDEVSVVISGGKSSTTALHGSTETEQFAQSAGK